MKTFVRLIMFSLLLCTTIGAAAQLPTPCDIVITGDFEPRCTLLTGKDDYYDESEDVLVACQGMTVTYTAHASNATVSQWHWEVSGASSWNDLGNGSATVNWDNGDLGQLVVTATFSGGSSCTYSIQVRLIEQPTIQVVTTPAYTVLPDGSKVIYVCRDETVTFTDLSSSSNADIVGYQWDATSGQTASTPNFVIEHVANNENIIHQVFNNCGCSSMDEYQIQILGGEILDLSCYGTVCEGSEVTYNALSPSCDQYSWYVEGGEIVGTNDQPSVTVVWNHASNGFGIIGLDGYLCGNDACPTLLSKKISVIQDHLPISGQTEVCVGDAVLYSVPLLGSTEYTWNINPSPGVLSHTYNGANQYLAVFSHAGTYRLSVNYRCEFLDCGTFSSEPLTITVKPKLAIQGDNRVCISAPCSLSLAPSVSAQWTVEDLSTNQVIHTLSSSNSLGYTFPHTGNYRVSATHPDYCHSATTVITVVDAPPAPTIGDLDPDNPTIACANSGINLLANPHNPNYTIVWETDCDEDNPQSLTGNDVTISYGNMVCDILAYTFDPELRCKSATPYVHHVVERRLAPITIPSVIDVCPGTTIVWGDAEVPFQEGVAYTWRLQKDMQHCASVQGEEHNNGVTLSVHEMASGSYNYTFFVELQRFCCGNDHRDTIYIHVTVPNPVTLTLQAAPTQGCLDQLFEFTASGGNPSRYRWLVDDFETASGINPFFHTFTSSGNHNVAVEYNSVDYCTNPVYLDKVSTTVSVLRGPQIYGLQLDESIYPHLVRVIMPDPSGCTFAWYFNNSLIPGATASSTAYRGPGNYTCEVTGANGCTSRISSYISPNPDPCDNIDWADADFDPCSATLTLQTNFTNPRHVQWYTGNSHAALQNYDPSTQIATIKFDALGAYTVTATNNRSRCESSTYYQQVNFIPHFTFEKNCNEIIVHNRCQSVSGNETFKLTMGSNEYFFNMATASYTIPISSPGTYSISIEVTIDGETYTCSYDPIEFTYTTYTLSVTSENTQKQGHTCDNTPIELSASFSPACYISSVDWNFGDGSRYSRSGNTVCHMFKASPYRYYIVATAKDENGCPVSSAPFEIASHSHPFKDGQLQPVDPISCPGDARRISLHQNGSIVLSLGCNYYWHHSTVPSPLNRYATYYTDDYHVFAVDENFCNCSTLVNVQFLTQPTAAAVTDKTTYCLGEKVRLFGANSPDTNNFSYLWTITNLQTGAVELRHTATTSFTPPQAGSYSLDLSISDLTSSCSATDSRTITVLAEPTPPSIGFGGNRCINDPPVVLQGTAPADIHWNNGNVGSTANYYTPGLAVAYYLDPTSGCKSEEAVLEIEPEPNFDALLTGCYEKCKYFFTPNYTMNVWGLTSGYQELDWDWTNNGIPIDNGHGNYSFTPLRLPIPGFGDYQLDVDYVGGYCHVTSPELVINSKTDCDCDSIEVTFKKEWKIVDCNLSCIVNVTVCNNSLVNRDCFDMLGILFKEEYVSVQSTSFTSTSLAPGGCFDFQIVLDIQQLRPSTVTFSLHDECNFCTKVFSIDLSLDFVECETPMDIVDAISIRSDLSNQAVGYFEFDFDVSPCQTLLAFWTEPPMVIDYWFNGYNNVHGLGMIDMALLSQLLAADSVVCFHAITCDNNKLCRRTYCLTADELLQHFIDAGIAVMQSPMGENTDEQSDSKSHGPTKGLQLSPNPAADIVTVSGEAVSELRIIDMHGREMLRVDASNQCNIGGLAAGSYIVRVVSRLDDLSPEHVTYLRLVKY